MLKVFAHYYGYTNIKYKDDGRDYVTLSEYVSIHMTFSVMHSWITYFMFYNLFQSLKVIKPITDDELEVIAIFGVIIMLLEMCIFLTEYKDVVFGLVTMLCFVGMFVFEDDNANYFERV